MRKLAHVSTLAAVVLAIAAPLGVSAKGPTSTSIVPLTATMYDTLYDEQTGLGCPFPPWIDATGLIADNAADVSQTTYDFGVGSPWIATPALPGGVYDNGTFGNASSFLRVEFNTSDKNFTIDTRNTTPPRRTFTLDFSDAYSPAPNVPSFGSSITVPALFQVQGLSAITGMQVCSSNACPESRVLAGKLWWDDPTDSSVQWRVDWGGVRVLRMSQQTWYFIASACGGTQVAGLSKLIGNRTKPREVNSGKYLIPIFIKATTK